MMWSYYEGSDSNNSEHHDENPNEVEGEYEVDSVDKKETPQLHL